MAGDQHSSASAKGDQVVTLTLAGGVDRSGAPNMIPQGYVWLMRNLYFPRDSAFPRTRPGLRRLTPTALPGMPTGLHVYQKSANEAFIVATNANGSGEFQMLHFLDDADSYAPALISANIGFDITPPSLRTFAGRLIVGVPGEYLHEWNGLKTGTGVKSYGNIAVSTPGPGGSYPEAGETFTIGAVTWTFQAERLQALEVTIGTTAEEFAANIVTAINQDTWEVVATQGTTTSPPEDVDTDVVYLTARFSGVAGNDVELIDGTADKLVLSGRVVDEQTYLLGGVDGMAYEPIDTYEAPRGGIVTSDRNGRLVCAGDLDEPDTVFFCAPGNETSWAAEPYGAGEYWEIGYKEGNYFTALCCFGDEIWAHKGGQNREMYRMRITDPDPATWDLQIKPYSGTHAAIAHRAVASCGSKHVVLDQDSIGLYQGTDTSDEVRSGDQGNKVYDLISGIIDSSAFVAVNPTELYCLIFPRAGNRALVYHYGSDRWSEFVFEFSITAATYCEFLQTMLFAATDGHVYRFDAGLASDDGTEFYSELITGAQSADLSEIVLKQVMLDLKHLIAGTNDSGSVSVIVNRDESAPGELYTFTVTGSSPTFYSLITSPDTDTFYEAKGLYFASTLYVRHGGDAPATAEMLAIKVRFTGAAVVNSVLMRLAQHGRAKQ